MSTNKPEFHFKVHCPACHATTVFSPSNPFRPFCSHRCQELDLSKWASEEYRIGTEDTSSEIGPPDHEET